MLDATNTAARSGTGEFEGKMSFNAPKTVAKHANRRKISCVSGKVWSI